ncbi:MAG: extracellular solute-binding protein [Erysipelotrichaceae bacterium]|nr:extracellular solute-binding protein [Erysipelotrichaceae bacterium]
MKKKLFGLALTGLMAVGVAGLTSCGGSSVANAGEEFELLSLDEIKGTDEPVVVEFWHSFGHNIANALNPMVESFEAEMTALGYNIDVQVTSTGGGYDGLRERVNLGTRSKSIPTMILGYPDHFADYISNDILLPLDGFVNAKDAEIALEGVDLANNTNDFIPSYWAENQLTVKGETKICGIPFNKSTEIMVYNASLLDPVLEEKGFLDQDGNWTNPTWDQVWEVSDWVLDNKTATWTYNGAPYELKDVEYPVYVDSEANFFITVGRQWGGDGMYTTVDAAGEGTVVSNNSTNKTVQEYFKEKADDNLFQFPAKKSQSYGSNLMQNQSAVISIGSTAGINNNASKKYELKATGIPQKAYGENANNAVIQQGTNLAILSANSNNQTRLAAWMLIKYLTNTENTQLFSRETGYLPVRQSALDSADYKAFLSAINDPFEGMVARAVNAAFSQKNYFYTDPAFTGSSIVRDYTGTLVQDIFIYDRSFDDAIKTLYDELNSLDIKTK